MDTGDSGTDRESQLRSCLARATRVLDQLRTPWVIVGALAAERYRSTARTTTDADLLVVWHPDLPAALELAGFTLRIARDGDDVHLIRARRSDGAIDLIVAGTDYQRLAIDRGVRSVLTIEDVLIHKLIAWRPKDRDDVRSILEGGHEFDHAYVEHWVAEWDVEDRWREAQRWR